jgi:hypothetical protein
MTDETTLSFSQIVAGLSRTSGEPPLDSLSTAADRWSELAEPLLRAIAEAGETDSPEADSLTCWAIYLAGHKRDPRALPLLCTLAAKGDRLEEIIGDGTTMDFPAILIRCYGGDPGPLRRLIETESADEFLRAGALTALTFLVLENRIARDEGSEYMRWLYEHMEPKGVSFVWSEWAIAVAALGLADLMPCVENAYRAGWADEGYVELEELRRDLASLEAGADPFLVLDDSLRLRIDEMDDLLTFVSDWRWEPPVEGYDPAWLEEQLGGRATSSGETYHNPYRNVGRNDPCPCGSGKKFKKCCLDVVG